MNTPRILVLACILLVAACDGQVNVSASTTTGMSSTTSSSGGGCAGVCGTMINTYFPESEPPLEMPVDLTATPIEALVWQGDSWATYTGTGKADGSFSVAGVPSGPLVLRAGALYVRSEARTLDLGTEVAGRPDPVQAVILPTVDTFSTSVQNLVPGGTATWSDFVGLVNLNGNGQAFLVPPLGVSSLVQVSSATEGGLVDASKGDVLHVYQEHEAPVTHAYGQTTIVRHAAITGIEQQHGTTALSVTLEDVTPTETLTLDFRGSEFAALVPAISPSPGEIDSGLSLLTAPGVTQAPAIWSPTATDAAPCLACLEWYQSACTDVSLSSVAYGNPFPAAWGSMIVAYQEVFSAYPKASETFWANGVVSVAMTLEEASAGPIRPEVSPVQNFRIAGQDAFGSPTATGLVPSITWDPPSLGSPSAYRVAVWSARPCINGYSGWGCPPAATIVTTETSVVMPPGVLAAGGQYQVLVTAEVSPVDVTTKPFRHGPRLASADAVSNLATP